MVDGFSCILDFPKFSGGGPPLIKEIHQLNPQNLSSTTTTAKGKKEPESLPPLKQPTRKFIFRKLKKEEGAGARSFLCDL